MRMARVIGKVVLNRKLSSLHAGRFLIAEALDAASLEALDQRGGRMTLMPESLVGFDEMGAMEGQIIALSEGGEAAMPFYPRNVPIDAYCAAILDQVELTEVKP